MKTRPMRSATIIAILLLAALSSCSTSTAPAASGQQVTMLEVRKEAGEGNRTTVKILLPMDLQGFDFDNPMDAEQTALATFSDDQGRDLLQIHENQQAELREQGYSTYPALSYGGMTDDPANKGIKIRVSVEAAASDGADSLHMEGTAVFNFAGEGEPEEIEIVELPVEMPYGSEGFASEIGPIIVSSDGFAEMDDVTYSRFTVSGTENTIVSASPVGGDDSAEVEFWGVRDNQFVFKEVPDLVTLEIRYMAIRQVPVDFDLEFSVGL